VTMVDADLGASGELITLLDAAGFERIESVSNASRCNTMLMVPAELALGEVLYNLHHLGASQISILPARDRKLMPLAWRGDNRGKDKPFYTMVAFHVEMEKTLLEFEPSATDPGAKWGVEDKITLDLSVKVGESNCLMVAFETAATQREVYVYGASPDEMDQGGTLMTVLAAILGLTESDIFATSQAYNVIKGAYLVRFPKSAGSRGSAQMTIICELEAYSTLHGFTPISSWDSIVGGSSARGQPKLIFAQTENTFTESLRKWVKGAVNLLNDQRAVRMASLHQAKTAEEVSAVGALVETVTLAQIAMQAELETQRQANDLKISSLQEEHSLQLRKHECSIEANAKDELEWRDEFANAQRLTNATANKDRTLIGQAVMAQVAFSSTLSANFSLLALSGGGAGGGQLQLALTQATPPKEMDGALISSIEAMANPPVEMEQESVEESKEDAEEIECDPKPNPNPNPFFMS
jgi:hypothetical protein